MRSWLALLAVLALIAVKVALSSPPVRIGPHTLHGAYHVHSNLSDGSGTPEQIAAAAKGAGLDFVVLSDHNRLEPSLLKTVDGVLMIPATEESTSFGHVISLGASRPLSRDEKTGAPLAAIRALGGKPMLAHPLNRKMPFTGWSEVALASGMEVLSDDDLWREALHSPFSRGLFTGVLELPFNPRLAVSQIIRRPEAALARWDALRKKTPLVQACAVDAHGWPGYAPVLESMSMYLDGVTSPSGPAILDALAQGHGYCGVDAVAPADGFTFVAEDQSSRSLGALKEGMEGAVGDRTLTIKLPANAPTRTLIVLIHDGAASAMSEGHELIFEHATTGDWRVEVDAPLPGALWSGPPVPWILSNVIRLR